ncbi:hypothetical protein RR46_13951 [Papilio xuthus]|uniref:Uncharacterized protein n=1 Tax=Papilio xuthus TaxID=66420 RepID=A0A194PNN1_PAPXU|nr:hypothetical protein RR46_13951 [Papilio xuthus]
MAAVFWTGAEVETRSKDNDEQTMIGGAIWTQIVLTIGLIISTVVDDHIQPFVEDDNKYQVRIKSLVQKEAAPIMYGQTLSIGLISQSEPYVSCPVFLHLSTLYS